METEIIATCRDHEDGRPGCGQVRLPASAMLINTIPGLAWHGWYCPSCGEYRTVECCPAAVDLLLSGDVPMIVAQYPDELDEAHVGPVITEANCERFERLCDVLTLLAPFAGGVL